MRNHNHDWSNLENDLIELGSMSAVARKYGCPRSLIQYHVTRKKITPVIDLTKCDKERIAFGRKAELDALAILKGAIDVNKIDHTSPYDILWEGKKINVRAKKHPNRRSINSWNFHARRKNENDMFLFMIYNDTELKFAYLVPTNIISGNHYTININCPEAKKYQIYPKN